MSPGTGSEEDPLVGALLQGKYRVESLIGQGGMGRVYAGSHTLIGRRVAIKTLLPRYAQDEEAVRRFRREAQASTAIGHQHIIDVTDMGRLEDGGIFLVLEHLEGCDLEELIELEGVQPVGRMAHITLQMCEALCTAHEKGIVHRDLKPSNLFLIERGRDSYFLKILDFGISKLIRGDDLENSAITRSGSPVGTPLFMAPEQARGRRDLDHRVDIYSMGVILFHSLTGSFPFEDPSVAGLFVKILTDRPPDVRELRPELPAELAELVSRMLAKHPSERPADCAEVARVLAPFADPYDEEVPQREADDVGLLDTKSHDGPNSFTRVGVAYAPAYAPTLDQEDPDGEAAPDGSLDEEPPATESDAEGEEEADDAEASAPQPVEQEGAQEAPAKRRAVVWLAAATLGLAAAVSLALGVGGLADSPEEGGQPSGDLEPASRAEEPAPPPDPGEVADPEPDRNETPSGPTEEGPETVAEAIPEGIEPPSPEPVPVRNAPDRTRRAARGHRRARAAPREDPPEEPDAPVEAPPEAEDEVERGVGGAPIVD